MRKGFVFAGLLVFAFAPLCAQPAQLATVGCSMAHCDPQLSDQTNATPPATGAYVVKPSNWTHGSGDGLGCASNLSIVACSFGGHKKNGNNRNLRVFDGDGKLLFSDAIGDTKTSLFDFHASYSAPVVFADGSVLAVDDHYVAMFKAGYPDNVVWQQAKTDGGTPISPVMLNANIMVMATKCKRRTTDCPISTWDINSGTQLDAKYINDGNTVYQTYNTLSVDTQHSRVYALTSAVSNRHRGRLQALDIDPVTGIITISSWHFDFSGPSGSSPLIVKNSAGQNQIFFDGVDQKVTRQLSPIAAFYGVLDTVDGGPPVQLWKQTFNAANFMAAAAHDPRGGIWIYPLNVSKGETKGMSCTQLALVPDSETIVSPYGGCLIRLGEADGSLAQGPLDPGILLQSDLPYFPSSAVTVSQTGTGDVVLMFGAVSCFHSRAPSVVMAVDVTPPQAALYWSTSTTDPIGTGIVNNLPAGQFPIVVSPSGKHRVVFTASRSGPFFIGDP